MTDHALSQFVELPEGLPRTNGEPLRLSYVSIANDVARVQQYWANGQGDPRSQRATYAGMFFELVEKLGAEGLLFTTFDTQPPDGQAVQIDRLAYRRGKDPQAGLVDELDAKIRAFQPHFLIVSPSVPAALIKRVSSVCPTIFYAHSLFWPAAWDLPDATIKQKLRRQVRILKNRRNFRGLKAVIASSDLGLKQFGAVSGSKIASKVVERQFYQTVEPVSSPSSRNLLYVGSFNPNSGAEMVIEGYQSLLKHVPDLKLTMIGEGSNAEEFSGLAEKNAGLEVTRGFDAEAQRVAVQKSGLLIVPEPPENVAATTVYLAEALVCGVPALVSSSTPTTEIERPGCAVFKAGDLASFEAELGKLVQDPNEYQRLLKQVPINSAPYFDRKQSWGSAIADMLKDFA